MNKVITLVAIVMVILSGFTLCSGKGEVKEPTQTPPIYQPTQPQEYQQPTQYQQNPQEYQQPIYQPQPQSSALDAIVPGIAGFAVGNALARMDAKSNSNNRPIINKTIINRPITSRALPQRPNFSSRSSFRGSFSSSRGRR